MGYDCDLIQGLGLGSRNGVRAPLHPHSHVGVCWVAGWWSQGRDQSERTAAPGPRAAPRSQSQLGKGASPGDSLGTGQFFSRSVAFLTYGGWGGDTISA